MDFHTFCEQHMAVLEDLDHEEVSRQAVMSEWERRQNEAKVKELQKNAMTSVTRLNKKIKEQRIKIKELEEKVRRIQDDADVYAEEQVKAQSEIDVLIDVIEQCYGGGWEEMIKQVSYAGVMILKDAGFEKNLLRAPTQDEIDDPYEELAQADECGENVMDVCAKNGAC
jgi:chromosome segregation ATPase